MLNTPIHKYRSQEKQKKKIMNHNSQILNQTRLKNNTVKDRSTSLGSQTEAYNNIIKK